MTTYPCISLWQPWASALFLWGPGGRLKTHETRSWAPPKRLIGQRVAIHAAKKRVPRDEDFVDQAMDAALGGNWRDRVPYGAVVGTAVLESFMPSDSWRYAIDRNDQEFGDWGAGRFAWRMDDPQLLAEPIPWKGQQGWFTVDLP